MRIDRVILIVGIVVWLGNPTAYASPMSRPAAWLQAPHRPGEVIVKMTDRVAEAALAGLRSETRPELAKLGLNVLKVSDDELLAAIAALEQEPGIEFAQLNYLVQAQETPDDPGWGQQYGPVNIQAPQAWDITTGTVSMTIAIVDTGIDLSHPDLAAKIVTGTTFVTTTVTAQDDNGHGTHVAGIAGAIGNNATGIAGIDWGVRLMPVKVLDYRGEGDDADLAAGIVWAVDHGADVINLSLGGPCPTPAVDLAATYAYTMGVTIIAAAGNSGGPGVLCPAALDTVIAVAATDPVNGRAVFSSFGPQVDLAAPGIGIFSTVPVGPFNSCAHCAPSGYDTLSGTSMATPHVAGAAALLASLPQFDTPDKIRAALEYTALDLGPVCRDDYYGLGLVQVYAALQYNPLDAHPPKCFWSFFPVVAD